MEKYGLKPWKVLAANSNLLCHTGEHRKTNDSTIYTYSIDYQNYHQYLFVIFQILKRMRGKNKYLLLLATFVLAFYSNIVRAQTNDLKFDHLTINDGLSGNRIWCIHRDSKDFLWISTDLGLDKYDSYEVKKYRFDEKLQGTISNDVILCIYEDINKNLWFGSRDGLNLYNPIKDNFKVFKNNPNDKNTLNSNRINSIIEDKNGTLWIVTDESCLNKWVPQTQSFIRYPYESKNFGLVPRPSNMAAFDSKGNIWVVSLGHGIFHFETGSGKFVKYDNPSIDFGENCYKSLYIDSEDKIWITTDGYGFISYDPMANKFEQFGSNGDGKGTNKSKVLAILPEDNDHLLLAVDQGGINRFNKVTKKFEYITYDNADDKGLNNNGIWCFHRDREGILWVGTSGGGINYINPKKDKFKLFKHSISPKSLSYSLTGCFYEDHEGLVWIGTDGGGVNVYNPATEDFVVYKNNSKDPFSISGNAIRSISEDKDQNIWIGTWDAGLNRYDRKTGKFHHYLPDKADPSSLSGTSVWNLFIDHNGLLWLAIPGNGINLFDTNKKVVDRFSFNPEDKKSISNNKIWLFYEDYENNMWVCTQNGLNLYDPNTKSFKKFNFPGNSILAFRRDRDGCLWVGSESKGIFYCKPDGTIIKTYNISNGLPSDQIQAIVEDNQNNLWISTGLGISCFDRKSGTFRNYSKEDGLQGDQFFPQSFLKTRKGEIYFGGYNGFNSFYPDKLKDNDFISPVYITDFQIFNKPVNYNVPGSRLQTHITQAKEITLEADQSMYSFSFAAINYTFPAKNQYAYRMEGFEKNWNQINSSRRYVTYTNLDPGNYTFHIKASNNDGVWNEKGISLNITILPPWWKTTWFRLLVLLTIGFGIYSFFSIKMRLNRKKQEELSILVEQRTREITSANTQLVINQTLIESQTNAIQAVNEELTKLNKTKDRMLSIIAHDLRNPFNVVSGFSEILIEEFRELPEETVDQYLKLISNASKNGSTLLGNLLQWSRAQTGNITFEPIRLNLMLLTEEIYSYLEGDAHKKNINIQFKIDPTLNVVADENMLKTILRNLISNAIKFTHLNGSILVKSSLTPDYVEICVNDSGVGVPEEKIPLLFSSDSNISTKGTSQESGSGLGLILCKEFVEKHHGRIWVETKAGTGSQFKFTIPIS
jgi:signal transduction histidine kinase/ligand-binding sensor domain-containing protein